MLRDFAKLTCFKLILWHIGGFMQQKTVRKTFAFCLANMVL